MKKGYIIVAFMLCGLVVMAWGSLKTYSFSTLNGDVGLLIENVEALSSGESGAKCPNGCRSIGWGLDKILECDCNYDHLSCCNSWGC